MNKKLFAIILSAILSLSASLVEGAAYIRFDGVDARSTGGTDTIEISSFNWGLNRSGTPGSPVLGQQLVFTATVSPAGATLMEAVAAGKVRSLTLLVPAGQTGKTEVYLAIELENVMVTSWSINGGSGASAGDDMSLSLNFEKYKTTFTEYGHDGGK